MPQAIEEARWQFTGQDSGFDGSSGFVCDFGLAMASKLVILKHLSLQQYDGSATSFVAEVWDIGAPGGDEHRQYQSEEGTPTAPLYASPLDVCLRLDETGKTYIIPTPDSGDGSYVFVASFAPCRELA